MVWFKFKENATPEHIKDVGNALVALKGVIPEIKEISFGTNFTTRTPHSHALLVKFDTKDALQAYADHPEHLNVIKTFIAPIKDDIIAMDYIEGDY